MQELHPHAARTARSKRAVSAIPPMGHRKLVGDLGFEPKRPEGRQGLSLLRLPVPSDAEKLEMSTGIAPAYARFADGGLTIRPRQH